MKIIKVKKYGATVLQNVKMDMLRKTECMCMNCKDISVCDIASELYGFCKDFNLALMVTRCPYFKGEKK